MLKKRSHIIFVSALIVVLVAVLAQCENKSRDVKKMADVRGDGYIGDEACKKCHSDLYNSYHEAAHHNTSGRASLHSIHGSFHPDSNTYRYLDNVQVRMENRDSGLYQVAYMNGKERGAFPFGTVIGSGRKAQTFLYWYGDNVFQLPVSYSVFANSWVNSPNYPPDKVRFDRLINVGCFECHASFIKLKGTQEEGTRLVDYFERKQVIYGIDCERCHGPAGQHVDFHEKNPQAKNAKFIAAYASLPRQAKLDLCAQCHSGAHPVKKTLFYLKPGDSLSSYFRHTANDDLSVRELDVHGNQYQLLAGSQCFIKSNTLDCASCHNAHKAERTDMAVFSQRCMNCHQPNGHNFCTMASQLGKDIVNNCIDCHMPAAPSRAIGMKSEDQAEASPNLVRTHYISIYRDETQKFMEAKARKGRTK